MLLAGNAFISIASSKKQKFKIYSTRDHAEERDTINKHNESRIY